MLNFVPDNFIFIFLDAKDNQPELGKIWETKLFCFICKLDYRMKKKMKFQQRFLNFAF